MLKHISAFPLTHGASQVSRPIFMSSLGAFYLLSCHHAILPLATHLLSFLCLILIGVGMMHTTFKFYHCHWALYSIRPVLPGTEQNDFHTDIETKKGSLCWNQCSNKGLAGSRTGTLDEPEDSCSNWTFIGTLEGTGLVESRSLADQVSGHHEGYNGVPQKGEL